MDVTVILTTVGGPWLDEQLAALAGQTVRPEQIVLVNNGPAGIVDDVLRRRRPHLPGLEVVEDRGVAGCGYARNVGAALARFPGLLFLDDDDVVDAGYVRAMGDALDRADLVAARIDLERLNRTSLTARWGAMQQDGPVEYHDFLPWVIGGAMGVRRSTYREIGGFDTTFQVAEDTDFSWRAQLDADATVAFVPAAQLSYRLRAGIRPAFRQARMWARWDVALRRRYLSRGLVLPRRRLRGVLRWGRPVVLAATARDRDDLVVAARLLGGCVGRVEGARATRGRRRVRPAAGGSVAVTEAGIRGT